MLLLLDIYRRLLSVQIRSQLQYRTSFLFDLLATGLITGVEFSSIALVLQRFENIAGWRLSEVAFLFGLVAAAFGTMDMIFSGFDPQFFGRQVRLGTFDQMLLRPLNLTLQVIGAEFTLRRFGKIAMGIAIFWFALSDLEIYWTVPKLLLMPLIYLGLVCFFGGLFIIGSTIAFWTVESLEVVNIFTYGGSEMMSYPMHIYQDWMRRFFTYILPAIFLNYYPALYILNKPDPFGFPAFAPLLSPVVGVGILLIALGFWKFGVRHYQSTGT